MLVTIISYIDTKTSISVNFSNSCSTTSTRHDTDRRHSAAHTAHTCGICSTGLFSRD